MNSRVAVVICLSLACVACTTSRHRSGSNEFLANLLGSWELPDHEENLWAKLPYDRLAITRRQIGQEHRFVFERGGTASHRVFVDGKRHSDFRGTVDLIDYARLCQLADHFMLGGMETSFSFPDGICKHSPTTTIRLFGKETVSISDHGDTGPPELVAFALCFEALANRISWSSADNR